MLFPVLDAVFNFGQELFENANLVAWWCRICIAFIGKEFFIYDGLSVFFSQQAGLGDVQLTLKLEILTAKAGNTFVHL